MAAPMDLNVPLCDTTVLINKIKTAFQLGYEVVAINNDIPDLLSDSQEKSKKKKIHIKPGVAIKLSEEDLLKATGPRRKPFRQLSRISMVLKDNIQSHLINTPQIQNYDLIAITPTSEKTLQLACNELNIDIITIDVMDKIGFKLKRNTLMAAAARGLYFELQYSHAIRDGSLRRNLICNAQQLMFWCKGRNVILTSGCEKPMELRGPHDVANLGVLLDLSSQQAKDAVTRNCRAVICHSESRHVIKSTMKVEKISELGPADTWMLSRCGLEPTPITVTMDTDNNAPTHREGSSEEEEALHPKKKFKTGVT